MTPSTEAGRALLKLWIEARTHPPSVARLRTFTDGILAIEAEARTQVAVPEVAKALAWALRNNGGECPADDPTGYVKALLALEAATLPTQALEAEDER